KQMKRLPHPYDWAAKTLKTLRLEAKKTQFEAAKVLGIDEHTLYRYEAGFVRMSFGTLCKLLVFYGIPLTLEPKRTEDARPMSLDLSKLSLRSKSEAAYGKPKPLIVKEKQPPPARAR